MAGKSVSGIAILPPYFFTFTRTELSAYVRELADATDLPLYLYNVPAWTKHTLEPEFIRELSEVDNIVGVKESGDLLTLRRTVACLGTDREFRVLSGLTPFFDLSLRVGAHGIVDGLFALAPEYGVELVRGF